MRRTLLALLLAETLLGGSLSMAHADSKDAKTKTSIAPTASLGEASSRLGELEKRLAELDTQLRPPAEPGADLAERRLIDAQVLYELKNYEAASIILFDIVEKYASSPTYPEALFYLADALYMKRDYFSSRRYFEKIVEVGASQKRYQDALQRLIELALHTGDYTPVEGYIQKLEAMGGQQLATVPYVKGKYFFFRQQYDKSIEAMKQCKADHPYYLHALYFIGASSVGKGGAEALQDAIMAFATILKVTGADPTPGQKDAKKDEAAKADTADKDKKKGKNKNAKTDNSDGKKDPNRKAGQPEAEPPQIIAELARLGLARIYLDQDQLTAALTEYGKVKSGDRYNDALYEAAWAHIKAKDYRRAAQAMDLLLLNAPDSPLAPEVKLLVGNLLIRQQDFGGATDQFGKTREDYQPIHRQLQNELDKLGTPPQYFRDQIQKNLDKFDLTTVLPQVALKWAKQEAEMQKATLVLTDISDLGREITDCDETIKKIQKVLSGPGRVSVFPELASARHKGTEVLTELLAVRRVLSNRERDLMGSVSGTDKTQLDLIEDQVKRVEVTYNALPNAADSIADRQAKIKNAFNELDKQAVEMTTELSGLRASLVATRKFYTETVSEKISPEQRAAADKELADWFAQVDGWQAAIDQIRKEIEEIKSSVGTDDAELKQANDLRVQYDELLKQLHDVAMQIRARMSSGDRAKANEIDALYERANALKQKLTIYDSRIEDILSTKLKVIESEIVDEKARLVGYRTTLTKYGGEGAEIGGGVYAEGYQNITKRFYNIVVRSDVGIIDVAWAIKDSATKEMSRLVGERKREMKMLEDDFKEALKDQQ